MNSGAARPTRGGAAGIAGDGTEGAEGPVGGAAVHRQYAAPAVRITAQANASPTARNGLRRDGRFSVAITCQYARA